MIEAFRRALKDGRKIDAIRALREIVSNNLSNPTADYPSHTLGLKAAKDVVESLCGEDDKQYSIVYRIFGKDLTYIAGDSKEWCLDYVRKHVLDVYPHDDIAFAHVVQIVSRATAKTVITIE